MDGRREKILLALVIFVVIKHVSVSIMAVQKVIIYQHNAVIMMMALFVFRSKEMMVCKFDQLGEFASQFLLEL